MPGYPCCCEEPPPPIADCAKSAEGPFCTGDTTPSQVIINLPSISHAGTGRFSHAGGSFLLDHYGSKAAGADFVPIGPAIGGDSDPEFQYGFGGRDAGACAYFGSVIGTWCSFDVRPFAIYQLDPFGSPAPFADAARVIGYAYASPDVASGTPTSSVWRPLLAPSGSMFPAIFLFSDVTTRDCSTYTFTESYAGDSAADGENCAGGGAHAVSYGATTISLAPA